MTPPTAWDDGYEAGRDYAQEENGALAGVVRMPKKPGRFETDPQFKEGFETGYERWKEEHENNGC